MTRIILFLALIPLAWANEPVVPVVSAPEPEETVSETVPVNLETPPTTDTNEQVVRDLILVTGERLALMSKVAEYKYEKQEPIEDLEREKVVVSTFVKKALEQGIDETFAKAFIEKQIEAAKAVQRHLHAKWKEQGVDGFDKTLDLAKDIRPQLDAISTKMVESLKLFLKLPLDTMDVGVAKTAAKELPKFDGVDQIVIDIAIGPIESKLMSVKPEAPIATQDTAKPSVWKKIKTKLKDKLTSLTKK